MLTSLAWVFLVGLLGSFIFRKLHLPNLLGMLLGGILLGSYGFNLLDPKLLMIGEDLRQIALVIILTKVGLALDIKELAKVGRPAILMCFVPALFEIAAIVPLSMWLFQLSAVEALIIGSVIAAVSPAVIVPRMLKIQQEGYGSKKAITQLLMAGCSADDVFVIVLFGSFISMGTGNGDFEWFKLADIPISIFSGIGGGIAIGLVLTYFFKKFHLRDSVKVVLMLSIAFLLLALGKNSVIAFSGLLAVICIGLTILKKNEPLAQRLSDKYAKLWVGAELILFVLIGASVDINYALKGGIMIIAAILGALLFRMAGVWICLLKTVLTPEEKLFCMFSYLPKATVQAAIGAIPLSLNLACGQLVLSFAVISILLTAPLGAFAIDVSYKRLLKK